MNSLSDASLLQFSDGGDEWSSVPPWAQYLIDFGQSWPHTSDGKRRIALVSMPCESAGAGLIALGALRKRLGFAGADDRCAHFERFRSMALQGRGKSGVKIFDLRQRGKKRGPYFLDGKVDGHGDMVWALLCASPGTRAAVTPHNANYWKFADEPPVELLNGQCLPYGPLYDAILGTPEPVIEDNLSHTDSDICLAGRIAGEASTHKAMEGLRFRKGDGSVASLADLLTIHAWQSATVSRVVLFNTRTRQTDRTSRTPRLILADGDRSFLEVLQHFKHGDLVGVISRTADRERLERVGTRLTDFMQWYEGDEVLASQLPTIAPGITLSVLRER